MPITYEKPTTDVLSVYREVLNEHHRDLLAADVSIDFLFAVEYKDGVSPVQCLKHGGYPAAATVSIVNLKSRVLGQADALIIIDKVAWVDLGDVQKRALIDHELTHLSVMSATKGVKVCDWDDDKGELIGEVALDDIDRPKLRMRRHDFVIGGFDSIVDRYGAEALETEAVKSVLGDHGQYRWDFDSVVGSALAGAA